jgi:hypothetical protein
MGRRTTASYNIVGTVLMSSPPPTSVAAASKEG